MTHDAPSTTPRAITRLSDLWNPQEGRPLRRGDDVNPYLPPSHQRYGVTFPAWQVKNGHLEYRTGKSKWAGGVRIPLADLLPYLTRPTEGSAR